MNRMPILEEVEDRVDILKWSLYDTLRIQSPTTIERGTTIDLFTVPKDSEKNWIETNLSLSGILPQPQHFNIVSMRPSYSETNSKDVNIRFRENVGFQLWIGNENYAMGPMATFQRFEEQENLSEFLELVKQANKLGFKVIDNMDFRLGDSPIGCHILQGQQFKLSLTFNKAFIVHEDEFKLNWFLDGMISRAKQ